MRARDILQSNLATDPNQDFDQVASAVPAETFTVCLADVFRSGRRSDSGPMAASHFAGFDAQQRAVLPGPLAQAVGPGLRSGLAGSALFTVGRFLTRLCVGKTGVASCFGAAGSVVAIFVWAGETLHFGHGPTEPS